MPGIIRLGEQHKMNSSNMWNEEYPSTEQMKCLKNLLHIYKYLSLSTLITSRVYSSCSKK